MNFFSPLEYNFSENLINKILSSKTLTLSAKQKLLILVSRPFLNKFESIADSLLGENEKELLKAIKKLPQKTESALYNKYSKKLISLILENQHKCEGKSHFFMIAYLLKGKDKNRMIFVKTLFSSLKRTFRKVSFSEMAEENLYTINSVQNFLHIFWGFWLEDANSLYLNLAHDNKNSLPLTANEITKELSSVKRLVKPLAKRNIVVAEERVNRHLLVTTLKKRFQELKKNAKIYAFFPDFESLFSSEKDCYEFSFFLLNVFVEAKILNLGRGTKASFKERKWMTSVSLAEPLVVTSSNTYAANPYPLIDVSTYDSFGLPEGEIIRSEDIKRHELSMSS
jgi:hypothetical protein